MFICFSLHKVEFTTVKLLILFRIEDNRTIWIHFDWLIFINLLQGGMKHEAMHNSNPIICIFNCASCLYVSCGVKFIGSEWEFGQPTSMSSRVPYIHLQENTIEKSMGPLLLPNSYSLGSIALDNNQSSAERHGSLLPEIILPSQSLIERDVIAQAFITY